MRDIKTIVLLTGFTLFIQSFLKGNTQVRAGSQEIEPLRSLLSYVLKNHEKKKHAPPRFKVFTKDENDDSLEVKDVFPKEIREGGQTNEIKQKKEVMKKEKRKSKSSKSKDARRIRLNKGVKDIIRELEENKEEEMREERENRNFRENREGRSNIEVRENRESRGITEIRMDSEPRIRENRNNREGRENQEDREHRENKVTEDAVHNKIDPEENKNRENEFPLKRREVIAPHKPFHEPVDKEVVNNKEKNDVAEFADYRAFRMTKEKDQKVPEKHKIKRKKHWKKKIEKRTKLQPHSKDITSKELLDPRGKKHKQKIENIVISSEANDLAGGGKDVNITKTVGLDKPVDIIVHIKMNK